VIAPGVDWAGLRDGVRCARRTLEHGHRADLLVHRAASELEKAGQRLGESEQHHKTLALFAQLVRDALNAPRRRAIAVLEEIESAMD
jgi:hypothetical protein